MRDALVGSRYGNWLALRVQRDQLAFAFARVGTHGTSITALLAWLHWPDDSLRYHVARMMELGDVVARDDPSLPGAVRYYAAEHAPASPSAEVTYG